jgi:YbbR domain-containing protein
MDRLLRNNTFVKILALFLAVALWYVVNYQVSPQSQYKQSVDTYRLNNVSLSVKFDQDRLAIVRIPKTVTVELRGTSFALGRENLSPQNYQVYVDLHGLTKGTHLVPVKYSGFPLDLSVRIIPEQVEVVLEEKQDVEKEVIPQFIGNLPQGFAAGEATIKPGKVFITVPESRIKDIGQVQAVVNLEGQKSAVDATVPLRVLDKRGNPMDAQINPASVQISVPILSTFKVLPIKLNIVGESPGGISIASLNLKPDKVTVSGPADVIDKLTFYPGPKIDLSTIKADQKLQVKLPSIANNVKVDPDSLELEIKLAQASTRTFQDVPISIVGVGDGFNAAFVSPVNGKLNVTVKGTPENLATLKPTDLGPIVDVSGLEVGEQNVAIHMNLPPFITLDTPADQLHATVRLAKSE